jgi:hypothetical protein
MSKLTYSKTTTKKKKGMFGSGVAVTFQSAFHSEMHQNDIFFFIFLKLFLRKRSKTLKILIFNPKKNLTCYLYPLVQTGTEYIRIPKPNETAIVIRAYA